MQKYSCYEYEINQGEEGWIYDIWGEDYIKGYAIIRESSEYFNEKSVADIAAREHIDKLKSGGG